MRKEVEFNLHVQSVDKWEASQEAWHHLGLLGDIKAHI